jgi:hypothetical protein
MSLEVFLPFLFYVIVWGAFVSFLAVWENSFRPGFYLVGRILFLITA